MIRRVEEEPAIGFHSMGLSPTMLKALKQARYLTPTPIQAAFIPQALDGLDVIGQAKTGTGKTAAFGIPLDRDARTPQRAGRRASSWRRPAN